MNIRAQKPNNGRTCRAIAALCLAGMLLRAGPALLPFAYAEEPAGHIHTESCYSIGRHLVCGMGESAGHQHTDECWGPVQGALLCTDNTWEHMHTDECYEWSVELLCGLEEGEGAHIHDESCFEVERVLICEEDAYVRDDAEEFVEEDTRPSDTEQPPENTDAESPEPQEEESTEKQEEIIYGPGDGMSSMLQLERELNFAEVSDPTADVEDEVDWWRMFADMELSGNWAEDLLLVAESQLGYTESERNFSDEDPFHLRGYTRYGAWYGIPYGDWCAMFISFCLYYAEIPPYAFPYNCHCSEWVRELTLNGMYESWDSGYEPKRGDLIFFDSDMDEKAEHVGIIRDVDTDRNWIYTIEGNRYNYVENFILTKYDYSIIGYGVLPENPGYDVENPGVERQNGKVEIPPDPVEPTPPTWDSILDAAAGIKAVSITPEIQASRITY